MVGVEDNKDAVKLEAVGHEGGGGSSNAKQVEQATHRRKTGDLADADDEAALTVGVAGGVAERTGKVLLSATARLLLVDATHAVTSAAVSRPNERIDSTSTRPSPTAIGGGTKAMLASGVPASTRGAARVARGTTRPAIDERGDGGPPKGPNGPGASRRSPCACGTVLMSLSNKADADCALEDDAATPVSSTPQPANRNSFNTGHTATAVSEKNPTHTDVHHTDAHVDTKLTHAITQCHTY